MPDTKKKKLYDFYQRKSQELLKGNRHRYSHTVPLVSTILLASDGDEKAIERLGKLIDRIDINNNFDLFYAIIEAAITKQPLLIDKLDMILKKDKREKFFGYDSMPKKITLKNEVASSFSLLDDKFPETSFWDDSPIEHMNKCILWLKENKLNLNVADKTLIKKIQKTRLNDL